MNAKQAWIWLTESDTDLGVVTLNNRNCYLIGDDQVECDAPNSDGPTLILSQFEFLAEFEGSRFRPVQTQDMAG